MPLLLNCPVCEKGLKVPDDQRGKRVKCVCSHVFRVTGEVVAAATEKIVVACGACHARLRVPAAALGNKMHCPSCGQISTAVRAEGATPVPSRPKKAPPSTPVPALEDDVDYPVTGSVEGSSPLDLDEDLMEEAAPPAKGKGAKSRPPEDDAEDDWAPSAAELDDDEEPQPRRATKSKAQAEDEDEVIDFEDEDDAPIPRGKARRADAEGEEDDDRPAPKKAPARSRRGFVNALTFLFALLYIGFFVSVYFNYLELWPRVPAGPINPGTVNTKGGPPPPLIFKGPPIRGKTKGPDLNAEAQEKKEIPQPIPVEEKKAAAEEKKETEKTEEKQSSGELDR